MVVGGGGGGGWGGIDNTFKRDRPCRNCFCVSEKSSTLKGNDFLLLL